MKIMKLFDIISMIVFGTLTLITFVGGFYNWIHFILCAFCFAMFLISIYEYKQITKQEKCNGNKSV